MDDKEKLIASPPNKVDRRTAIQYIAAVVAGATAGRFAPQDNKPTPTPIPTLEPVSESKPILTLEPVSEKIEPNNTFSTPEVITDEMVLNHILELNPSITERYIEEMKYALKAETVVQIDKGFWVTTSHEVRAVLLDKRWKLREQGILPMNLTAKEIEWAKKEKINLETFAICKEAYEKAKKIIGDEQKMINVGGMTRLVIEETGRSLPSSDVPCGFNNIGEQAARKHINPTWTKDIAALPELCARLSKDTGLKFVAEKVPGSYGAGAIGLQFMPSTALNVYDEMAKAGEKFNPFDPVSSVVGAFVYLKMRGYKKGDPEAIKEAVGGWNREKKEMDNIIASAYSYSDTFSLSLAQR